MKLSSSEIKKLQEQTFLAQKKAILKKFVIYIEKFIFKILKLKNCYIFSKKVFFLYFSRKLDQNYQNHQNHQNKFLQNFLYQNKFLFRY